MNETSLELPLRPGLGLRITANAAGLRESGPVADPVVTPSEPDWPWWPRCAAWLDRWRAGLDPGPFPAELLPPARGIIAEVRAALTALPLGVTHTYGELAANLGRPGAARAVAGGCAANPVALFVPCHRIVAANGPGGYSGWGGVRTKEALLRHEGAWPGSRPRPRPAH